MTNARARERQGLWWWIFGAAAWRSMAYGLLSLPAGVAGLLLGLAGRPGAAARLQVGLAGCWLGLSLNPPRGWGRVVAHGLLSALLGLLCWALAALAGPNTLRNVLLYPITDGDDVARAWGGPSLAGAWAVHAALALVILPVELAMLRGLGVLQARLTVRLLGAELVGNVPGDDVRSASWRPRGGGEPRRSTRAARRPRR